MKIPPKYNGTVPIKIKGHDLQDEVAYFISNQHTKKKHYPIAMKPYNWVKDEIKKLLDAKVICSSHSSWSAPNIVIPKGDGRNHLVIDYRALKQGGMKVCLAYG